MEFISNAQCYLELLYGAEDAQKQGDWDRESAIVEEMDALWNEMTLEERKEVDLTLGMNIGV